MGQMKTFSEHSDLEEYKKTADITQRRKQARRMRLLSKQSGFKMKKKRTLMKVRDVGKITKSAKKQTIKMFRNKLYPNYNDMSISAKVKADQIVMQRFGQKIDKIAKRTAMKLRAAEPERVQKFRASQQATDK
jgi:hypothetical protein|tara:strand:+ start:555 stop:953 length:399 start_codon:yes stop_codon:yes gene_type:complete